MKVGQEVFKRSNEVSVRGFVKNVLGSNFLVEWQTLSGNKMEEFEEKQLGEVVFESESELIKSCGEFLKELAEPIEKELVCAYDFYGLPLEVGNRIIAMADEPLYLKVEGFISRIYSSSLKGTENVIFLDLSDEKGKVFYKKVSSRYFTTPERFARN